VNEPAIRIRPLTTIEECREVAALERRIWGYTDSEDVVPPPVLIVSIKRGGILLGAFQPSVTTGQETMVGFVYSLPGIKDDRVKTQWSHMLGVVPEARGLGLGTSLKRAQFEYALKQGIELIEWTYDPLQTMNAHFNLSTLGAIVSEYEVNIYGESSSPLHRGTPTDRFLAEWHITEPHVRRRLDAASGPVLRDQSLVNAPVINPSIAGSSWIRPGAATDDFEARRVLVEIPTGFTEMLAREPSLALEWRLATREIFQRYFRQGYRVVDFFLAKDRGQYLVVRRSNDVTGGSR
jgi:predicted GNAT superfamily acetyltransferase